MEFGTISVSNLVKVFFLGIIEGITEWLPVSSTGHLLLFESFLKLDASEGFPEVFRVLIQLGAILAVVTCFFSKMMPVSVSPFRVKKDTLILWGKIALAVLPSAVAGFFLDDLLEERFSSPFSVAIMLIAYGLAFILIEKATAGKPVKTVGTENIGLLTAFRIGAFQALSLIPGTSRSGVTVTGAMTLGVQRKTAAEFSFFLAVPTMLGASVLKLAGFGLRFTAEEAILLALGSLTAFVTSLLTIGFLMDFVSKRGFTGFGIYRIILGIFIIVAEYAV